MKRILVLSPYPKDCAASQRLKYEQYYSSWEESDYKITTSSFFDQATWKILYLQGHYVQKFIGTFWGYFRRLKDLSRLKKFDIIYIHLWATPIGLPLFEFSLTYFGVKVIYDFDDALFQKPDHFSVVNFIKGNFKAKYLIKNAHHLILSSPFLIEHCIAANKYSSATYIPCSLDTERFYLKQTKAWSEQIVIGWTGTFSSKTYLDSIRHIFYKINEQHNIKIVLITNFDYTLEGLDHEIIQWNESSEVYDLHKIDIGVYPLIKTNWALGKGGLKALQYMAAGIPAVATDYGTVKDFIVHQENGFLVNTEDDWINSIQEIIGNPNLRNSIIMNARETVEQSYSVSCNKKKYLNIFENLTKG
jgi:glycosyltransferase involved in cell wall biosynthesis